jgi:hypothetical protein
MCHVIVLPSPYPVSINTNDSSLRFTAVLKVFFSPENVVGRVREALDLLHKEVD